MLDQIYQAVEIITKSKRSKTGKLLVEFGSWEYLDDRARGIALSMFDGPQKREQCSRCFQYSFVPFTPITTPYRTMFECGSCTPVDYFEISNYARVLKELKKVGF